MITTTLASLALFGLTASASSLPLGKAVVVNACTYSIQLCDVPASGGGYEESDVTLAPGQTWEQTWTPLSNDDGWSIKLSPNSSLEDILQYEYTSHDDGIIWYDLSEVNGNPWDGNWMIESDTTDCTPKQQAYRYATDDAYGMQSCPQDAVITVTVCSGDAADNSTSSSSAISYSSTSAPSYESSTASASAYESTSVSASAYESTSASTPSSETATSANSYSTTEASSTQSGSWPTNWYGWSDDEKVAATTPTTFATQTTAVTEANGVTVTQVETAVVTAVVTAYGKRHEHHPHGHRHRA